MKRESEENNKKTSRTDDIYIPLDLTGEILSKLPVKSTVMFQCVSKLWSSLITDSLMTWSLAKPRLLVVLDRRLLESSVFSLSGNLLNTYKEPISAEQDSNTLVSGFYFNKTYQYTRGLICCLSSYGQFVIYNPTTRQSLLLPEIKPKTRWCVMDGLFGYDPVENQYKVLCLIRDIKKVPSYQVFTLGDPKKHWRNIRGFEQIFSPNMSSTRVCIKGKIYFRAGSNVLLSFDVRSERFDQGEIPNHVWSERFDQGEIPKNQSRNMTLVDYQGKLGCISYSDDSAETWIMEDHNVEKQEWSKLISFTSPLLKSYRYPTSIVGVTINGEIVIMPKTVYYAETLYAYFYDPKQNKTSRVGFESTLMKKLKYQSSISFFCVPDHVENAMSLLDLFH